MLIANHGRLFISSDIEWEIWRRWPCGDLVSRRVASGANRDRRDAVVANDIAKNRPRISPNDTVDKISLRQLVHVLPRDLNGRKELWRAQLRSSSELISAEVRLRPLIGGLHRLGSTHNHQGRAAPSVHSADASTRFLAVSVDNSNQSRKLEEPTAASPGS